MKQLERINQPVLLKEFFKKMSSLRFNENDFSLLENNKLKQSHLLEIYGTVFLLCYLKISLSILLNYIKYIIGRIFI